MSGPFGYLEGVTAAINRFSGWNKIDAAVAPAQPVYENTETGQRIPTKELLVKDVLPELEQATDIKQRIETVRTKPANVVNAPLQWYGGGATAMTYVTTAASTNGTLWINNFAGMQQSTTSQQQGLLAGQLQRRR